MHRTLGQEEAGGKMLMDPRGRESTGGRFQALLKITWMHNAHMKSEDMKPWMWVLGDTREGGHGTGTVGHCPFAEIRENAGCMVWGWNAKPRVAFGTHYVWDAFPTPERRGQVGRRISEEMARAGDAALGVRNVWITLKPWGLMSCPGWAHWEAGWERSRERFKKTERT